MTNFKFPDREKLKKIWPDRGKSGCCTEGPTSLAKFNVKIILRLDL